MNRTEAMNWVLTVCSALRLSQAKSAAAIAVAALNVGRVSLAALGRQLTNVSAKHGTKRVDRFLGNQRIEISQAMQGVIAQLLRRRGRKPPFGCPSRPADRSLRKGNNSSIGLRSYRLAPSERVTAFR
jgi:hypothetical protein